MIRQISTQKHKNKAEGFVHIFDENALTGDWAIVRLYFF